MGTLAVRIRLHERAMVIICFPKRLLDLLFVNEIIHVMGEKGEACVGSLGETFL